jgi:hypothetical protein
LGKVDFTDIGGHLEGSLRDTCAGRAALLGGGRAPAVVHAFTVTAGSGGNVDATTPGTILNPPPPTRIDVRFLGTWTPTGPATTTTSTTVNNDADGCERTFDVENTTVPALVSGQVTAMGLTVPFAGVRGAIAEQTSTITAENCPPRTTDDCKKGGC